MPRRCLVLDANIVIRVVLGSRVIHLLADNAERVVFITPDVAVEDARRHLAYLIGKHGLDTETAMATLDEALCLIIALPETELEPWRDDAISRIGSVDIDDWPILAAALAIDCPIWTEDRDFFGTGVGTWTTDRVELFFNNTMQ
jgi:predicted nucleic acid-binding protein